MNERRAFLKGLVAAAVPKGSDPLTQGGSDPLTPAAEPDPWLERYSRQLVLPQWSEAAQRALDDASVLVVGAGALGSPVATYLAGAGVGRLGSSTTATSRSPTCTASTCTSRPTSACPRRTARCPSSASSTRTSSIEPYQAAFNAAMLEGIDLVVDCTDAFATRYAINAACCAAGIPLVEGGVVGMSGLVMAIRPGETACYRCAFPQAPPEGAVPTCAQAGVLGPAAGVIGSLQALEALKLLAGLPALTDAFLQVDLATHDFLRVTVKRRDDCPDCGDA